MGYDKSGCLLCYLNGGGNNGPDDDKIPSVSICSSCFKKKSGPLHGRTVYNHYIEKVFGKTCDYCTKENCLVLHKVTMCEEHMPQGNEEELSESDNENDVSSDVPSFALCDAGKCKCIRCDYFLDSLLDRFNVNVEKPKPPVEYIKLKAENAKLSAENAMLLSKLKLIKKILSFSNEVFDANLESELD